MVWWTCADFVTFTSVVILPFKVIRTCKTWCSDGIVMLKCYSASVKLHNLVFSDWEIIFFAYLLTIPALWFLVRSILLDLLWRKNYWIRQGLFVKLKMSVSMKDLDPAFRGSGQKEYPFRLSFISCRLYKFHFFALSSCWSNIFPRVLASDYGKWCVVFCGYHTRILSADTQFWRGNYHFYITDVLVEEKNVVPIWYEFM